MKKKKCYYCEAILEAGICPEGCKQPSGEKIRTANKAAAQPKSESIPASFSPKISIRNKVAAQAADKTTLKMPDGTIIYLADYIEKSLYSSLIIEPEKPNCNPIELFSYGLSQQIVGSSRLATRIHTNVPRAGYSGLPQAWSGVVFGWRATTDVDTPEFRRWAMRTLCQFRYNRRVKMEASLFELLRRPIQDEADCSEFNGFEPPRDSPFMVPIRLDENLEFAVIIESQLKASEEFVNTLKEDVLIRVHLDGLWHTSLY